MEADMIKLRTQVTVVQSLKFSVFPRKTDRCVHTDIHQTPKHTSHTRHIHKWDGPVEKMQLFANFSLPCSPLKSFPDWEDISKLTCHFSLFLQWEHGWVS